MVALAVVWLSVPLVAQPAGQPARPGARTQATPARDAREAVRGTAIIRGFVVAADNGSPIRRALVRVSGPGGPPRLATTDAQGRFEVRELGAGRYTISASKGGFVSLQYGQKRPYEPGTPLELGASQVLEKLVIGLPRGSVISGRVTDEFGEPLANASVAAMRYGYSGGVRRLVPTSGNARDTTDDQGLFRLFGLPPGDYIVSAALRAGGNEITDPGDDLTGFAPTYYPGTPNVAEAQRVHVAVGQEQHGVTFALIATRLVRVSGAVLGSQGAPVAGATVTLAPPGGRIGGVSQSMSARTDAGGQFRLLNVAPGRYLAQVRTQRGRQDAPLPEFGRQDVTVGGDDLDGLVIVTGPGARVTGHITTESGAPPAIRPQQVQVAARLAEPDQTSMATNPGARVNPDWSFEITGLFDPRVFRVGAPTGWTLKAVLFNGQDITDTPFDPPPGQTIGGLQIVLTDRIAEVSGLVTDARGTAVADVTVVVFPADEARWTYQSRFVRTARPGLDGRYTIANLPALDRYLAVPVQGIEDGQAGDPDLLARLRGQATPFALNEGEARAVDLRIGRQ